MVAHIEVERLSKTYRHPMKVWKTIHAVKDLSFAIEPGEIVGFVGHNGAGKTTTLKMLMGLITPSSGTISLFGRHPGDPLVHRRIGFLPERPYFYDHLTGRELLRYFCGLSGLPSRASAGLIEATIKRVGLSDAGDLRLVHYSKGMLQRIGIAQAIVHGPEVVILDEPMSGLDPSGRREVKEIILSLKKEGRAILFSSHILSDIEDLSDRILIIERGERRFFGTLPEIIPRADLTWRVRFSAPENERDTVFGSFKNARLLHGAFVTDLHTEEEMNQTLRQAMDRRYTIVEAGPVYPSLEEVVFRMKKGEQSEGARHD